MLSKPLSVGQVAKLDLRTEAQKKEGKLNERWGWVDVAHKRGYSKD
jgi:hypothetical protein